jgi:hypothetical protein
MLEVCRISLLSAVVVCLIDVFRFAGMGLYLNLFLLDPYAAWPPAVSACVFPCWFHSVSYDCYALRLLFPFVYLDQSYVDVL